MWDVGSIYVPVGMKVCEMGVRVKCGGVGHVGVWLLVACYSFLNTLDLQCTQTSPACSPTAAVLTS